jgi:hypothetical protein
MADPFRFNQQSTQSPLYVAIAQSSTDRELTMTQGARRIPSLGGWRTASIIQD